ncbi:MAG: nucleotidyltransferase domain-containing protein [Algoriphagus sp.]|uniref:nucleotidyltransferase domain-containing protein n=1 Tax=Algoriphagus sp. TaxID=1872435 RepID=UPI002613B82E|nr:nucleotidyltransferase domain-containing protein [Algoriphagus sp.]MDG1278509.1 nucleotidyltransferase domain-containing protein [Algoriphagus sp.]
MMYKEIKAKEIGLSESDLNEIRDFARKNKKIMQVVLYGSRAKGNYKPGSDLDLVLIGDKLELADQLSFWADLDESWQPYFFDVAILQNIKNDELLDHINRVGKVIYEKL